MQARMLASRLLQLLYPLVALFNDIASICCITTLLTECQLFDKLNKEDFPLGQRWLALGICMVTYSYCRVRVMNSDCTVLVNANCLNCFMLSVFVQKNVHQSYTSRQALLWVKSLVKKSLPLMKKSMSWRRCWTGGWLKEGLSSS